MTQREAFEAWAKPILGDNPTWRESGDCELAWQAWQAAQPAQAAPRRLTEAEITLLVEAYYEDVGIAPPDLIRQVEGLIFGDAQPAQNEWKEAVIEQLAAHSMDAPVLDSPTVILAKIIHMAVLQATDPAIKVAQPAQTEKELRHRIRVHLANRNYYSHQEFCTKLEELMAEAAAPSTKEGQP